MDALRLHPLWIHKGIFFNVLVDANKAFRRGPLGGVNTHHNADGIDDANARGAAIVVSLADQTQSQLQPSTCHGGRTKQAQPGVDQQPIQYVQPPGLVDMALVL